MVRIILVLAVLLIGDSGTATRMESRAASETVNYEVLWNRSFDKYEAVVNACLYTKYSCQDLVTPKVAYQEMRSSLYGYYDGGDTIFINRDLRGWRRKATLMHESIHYLQVRVGDLRLPGPAEQVCGAEEEAFASVDAWLKDTNRGFGRRGPRWWKPYGHCYKWYDPDWTPQRGWWGRFL